jgi:hypothetical protein
LVAVEAVGAVAGRDQAVPPLVPTSTVVSSRPAGS